jgi:hypothetical protein
VRAFCTDIKAVAAAEADRRNAKICARAEKQHAWVMVGGVLRHHPPVAF